jgi:KTSC domain
MKPIAMESTTLRAVAYDADRQLLQLEFPNRTADHYVDVPATV